MKRPLRAFALGGIGLGALAACQSLDGPAYVICDVDCPDDTAPVVITADDAAAAAREAVSEADAALSEPK